MLQKGSRVLLDTMVIIEAHRTECWNALHGHFTLETVEMCCVELASGYSNEPGYVPVDTGNLRRTMMIHKVTDLQKASAGMRAKGMTRIDDGEKELLALAASLQARILLSCSDYRALVVGNELGLLDWFVSLQELAEAAGAKRDFKSHYLRKWLSDARTRVVMESL